jgi:hypothetical protein
LSDGKLKKIPVCQNLDWFLLQQSNLPIRTLSGILMDELCDQIGNVRGFQSRLNFISIELARGENS